MDPASCIITIIDTSLKITQYIKDVSDGRKERQELNREILSVYQIFLSIQDQIAIDGWETDAAWARSIRPLLQPEGAVQQLRGTLEQVSNKLTVSSQDYARRAARALKWPLEKSESKQLTDRIKGQLLLITTAIGQANLELSKDTNTGVTYVKSVIEAQTFNETLNWISLLDFRAVQESPQKRPVKGTGRWFLDCYSYRSWSDGRLPVIWCHGIPGAGKTILASAAFDHMKEKLQGRKVALLIAFCAFDEQRTHTSLEILSGLLRQTVRAHNELSEPIRKLYTEHTAGHQQARPTADQICSALKTELVNFQDTFIILDGLDEMPDQQERGDLLQRLEAIEPRPKLMATSRPLPEIRSWFTQKAADNGYKVADEQIDDDFEYPYCDDCDGRRHWSVGVNSCSTCSRDLCEACLDHVTACPACNAKKESFICTIARAIQIAAQPEDIERYIDWRIDTSGRLRGNITQAKAIDLRQKIIDKVLADAQQMFLLAKFHMNVLVDEPSARMVLEALEKLPNEVKKTYDKVFERIDCLQVAPTLRRFIVIIACANTLLDVRSLEHALAVESGCTELDELNVSDAKDLASLCAGLVDVDSLGFVRLAHETVGYYIADSPHETFRNGDSLLATTCLTYLQFSAFSGGACCGVGRYTELVQRKQDYPFLSYSALNWGRHALESGEPDVLNLATAFLDQDANVEAAVQIMWQDDAESSASWDAEEGVTGLHLAAHYGLAKAAAESIAKDVDVDVQDCLGTTPLMYAASAGHSGVVEILLHAGADPGIICDRGCTALHRACQSESVDVVRQLVGSPRNIAINALDARFSHRSPLMWAVDGYHPEIVVLLFQRDDIDVNRVLPDHFGYNAFHKAAVEGQADMVAALLNHPRIDVNATTSAGETALILATVQGVAEVVELLLDHGADPEILDSHGGPALLRAVDWNHLPCVKILIKRGVQCQFKDHLGRNILHGCAVNDRAKILRYLLETVQGLDPNSQGNRGETPLHDAVLRDYDQCVRVLLDFGARTDVLDNTGRSAARAARDSGSHKSLPLLREARVREVEQADKDARARDNAGEDDRSPYALVAPRRADTFGSDYKMPVHSAVRLLDTEALQSYLNALGPDLESSVNKLDNDMLQTPLHVAARRGKAEAVRFLLDNGADVNIRDMWGWSPLHLAVEQGYEKIAEQLLDRGADIDALDALKRSPLEFATSQYLQPDMAFLLIKRGAFFDQYARHLLRLLTWASEDGDLEVVRRLAEAGVPFQLKASDGLNAYQRAKAEGHEDIADFLYQQTQKQKKTRPPLTPALTSEGDLPIMTGLTANPEPKDTEGGAESGDLSPRNPTDAQQSDTDEDFVLVSANKERHDQLDGVKVAADCVQPAADVAPLTTAAAERSSLPDRLGLTVRECCLISVICLLVALLTVR